MHENDVRQRLVQAVGSTRATAWCQTPDMTSNPAWYVYSQLAALYREIPEVRPPDGGEDAAAALSESGHWQLAQRLQRDTLALNDHYVRVDITDDQEPSTRLIPPDLVEVVTHPLRPSQPLSVKEWIPDPETQNKWVKLNVDPRNRIYVALDDRGNDVSDRILGGNFSGENYPWVINEQAVLPYVAYHSSMTGYPLDPYSGREVFEGALQLGVLYSFFQHTVRNVAWAQRYILGAEPLGMDVEEEGEGRRAEVEADPATLLALRPLEDIQGQPMIGQWSSPVDPSTLLASIERYERRITEMALGQVGVSRRESDVRSAMSLAVSRESQRQAQRAYEPVFRRSDLRLLRLVSGLMGGPTSGWRINYKSIPRDAAEMAAEMDRMSKLIEAGLLDRVSAYQQLHPGLSRQEAEKAIEEIAKINRAYAA
ncbi:MAG: hypothetical protein H6739_29375 [Alphaproteobacteria bacterium]|nr:hypothetical protein [Alphaproteobacteria bacterium]